MKKFIYSVPSLFLIFVLIFSHLTSGQDVNQTRQKVISAEDQKYLHQILKETWDQINYLVEEKSGVPFDNSTRQNYTSMSNIGLYLACVFGAQHLGYISQKNAMERVSKGLDFLEKLEKWHGFPPSWVQVYHPVSIERIVSPVDSAHLAAGLLLCRQAYPSLGPRITKMLQAMDWRAFYDEKLQALKGGFNLKKNEELHFHYSYLGTDLRMAFFLTIATDSAPVKFWDSLNRFVEERYGIQYLAPGWRAGGLFLNFMVGLFLDERGTLMGKSAANMAYAQIIHAWKKGYPVWGWSACASPDGSYLGANKLIDRVVTPHASILAISYYPSQVIENLKAFEKFNLRKVFHSNEGPRSFGFRDAVDIESGRIAERFLIVDQEMIFLSLLNFLEQGILWKTFKKDPLVQKGFLLIKDYQKDSEPDVEALYQKRDIFGAQEKVIPLELGIKNPIVKPFVEPLLVQAVAKRLTQKVTLDGSLEEWENLEPLSFPLNRTLELGIVMSPLDLDAKSYFQWDEKNLYFAIEVTDSELLNQQGAKNIFKEDCVELFINPANNGLKWGDAKDFQIGFSPTSSNGNPAIWAWFQSRAPKSDEVSYFMSKFKEADRSGYIIEAAISWKFLNLNPKSGLEIGVSPAVHDVDNSKTFDTKLNWCFMPANMQLGTLKLEE